ncbi:hypothetical protein [Oceanobacillus sp. AG]|uniref:hypothetical protein n=1 Tax=Oceanobacillus sp. AG TaxID=2681969 RepID=UPI0018DD4940|nr:hypothetical protein [Oceanobacillus sp. AG]
MIIKPLTPPLELLQIEALNERLPSHHKEKGNVEQQAKNLRAGYHGEHALQYNLGFLPYEQYLIFQQLRLNKCTVNLQMPKLTTQMLRFTNGRVPGTTEHPPAQPSSMLNYT